MGSRVLSTSGRRDRLNVSEDLMSTPADQDEFATFIRPPGKPTEKTLAEFLSIDPDGETARHLRADFAAIKTAERDAEVVTAAIRLS